MPRMAQWIVLVLLNVQISHANYMEVTSRTIGPRNSLGTNNTNAFDWNALPPQPNIHSACDLDRFKSEHGHAPCAAEMQWVCSQYFQISVCVDKDLQRNASNQPTGNLNRNNCSAACATQGKRLLNNNEWLVACTGSPINTCLNYQGEWPPGHFAKVPGHPCQVHGVDSEQCMTNPELTNLLPAISPACESEALVRGCIGTLGQWVSDSTTAQFVHGKFNGGLFPQPASSSVYTTTAHGPGYSDYSIGCRCGSDVNDSTSEVKISNREPATFRQ